MFNWGMGSVTLFTIGSLMFIIWLRALFKQNGLFNRTNYLFYLLLVTIASIAFWFFVAPEVRFANGIFIIFFITALLMVKTAYPKLILKPYFKKALMFFPIIMFVWCFVLELSINTFHINGIEIMEKAKMKTFVTDSGLKLLVPTLSDQCWDSELPSTPEPRANLALRGSTIDDGFYITEKSK